MADLKGKVGIVTGSGTDIGSFRFGIAAGIVRLDSAIRPSIMTKRVADTMWSVDGAWRIGQQRRREIP